MLAFQTSSNIWCTACFSPSMAHLPCTFWHKRWCTWTSLPTGGNTSKSQTLGWLPAAWLRWPARWWPCTGFPESSPARSASTRLCWRSSCDCETRRTLWHLSQVLWRPQRGCNSLWEENEEREKWFCSTRTNECIRIQNGLHVGWWIYDQI